MKATNTTKIRLTLCNLALFCTAAFAQPASVGPHPMALDHRDYRGTLVVYTPTEAREDGKDAYYYPHTSYEVYRDGHPFRHVDNGRTLEVETPDQVHLPQGNYEVVTQGEKVPVRIETGRKTVIHLADFQD
jgi:hypothetical protein